MIHQLILCNTITTSNSIFICQCHSVSMPLSLNATQSLMSNWKRWTWNCDEAQCHSVSNVQLKKMDMELWWGTVFSSTHFWWAVGKIARKKINWQLQAYDQKINGCWSSSLIPVLTKSTGVLETSTISVLLDQCKENWLTMDIPSQWHWISNIKLLFYFLHCRLKSVMYSPTFT